MTKRDKVEEFLTRIFRDYPVRYEIKCQDISGDSETYRIEVSAQGKMMPVFLRVLKSNVIYILKNGQYVRTSEMDFIMELFLTSFLIEI